MIELGEAVRSSMSDFSIVRGADFASGFSITFTCCGVSSRTIPVTIRPPLVWKTFVRYFSSTLAEGVTTAISPCRSMLKDSWLVSLLMVVPRCG